jgi:hypothetical protein
MTARGHTGTLTFDGVMVTIERTGVARATLGTGSRAIPINHITAVQFKKAGRLVNGFIRFTLPGGVQSDGPRAGSQTLDAARDENAVVFTRAQMEDFAVIRGYIESALVARSAGPA